MSGRTLVLWAASLTLAVALFVLLNSGWVGERFCGVANSTGRVSLSWWPPGAECLGGTEDPVDVRFNWLVVPVFAALVWPVFAFIHARGDVSRRRARTGGGA